MEHKLQTSLWWAIICRQLGTCRSDGNGGTVVVDPVAPNNWQTLDVGAGGLFDWALILRQTARWLSVPTPTAPISGMGRVAAARYFNEHARCICGSKRVPAFVLKASTKSRSLRAIVNILYMML